MVLMEVGSVIERCQATPSHGFLVVLFNNVIRGHLLEKIGAELVVFSIDRAPSCILFNDTSIRGALIIYVDFLF